MNEDRVNHVKSAVEWLEFGAVAVAVPVVLTTTHATVMNYWRSSEHNATLGKNETWDDTINNVF